ncbi:MAG: hypothetical protein ACR652_13490 [Methylocystis sp.]|uniref:hypothetical protein n=1 Tax=Methylocystis sp. TaxID=1911079 RepID=UPI003DA270D3
MATLVKAGPAERAARKKIIATWAAENPEVAQTLLARVEAGDITDDELWQYIADRRARKKALETWIAKNPEECRPLLARLETGEITEEELWEHAKRHAKRVARVNRIGAWIEKNQGDLEAERVLSALMTQLDDGEITEEDFWWLLGSKG